ncbi:MAG TPA: hypothetical protein VFT00_04660 [Nocardioides sp.]|nr:hypothetical protein [Nocardioides sp.]
MRNPDEFDAFYKDARDRLLLQTYALTGDLPAARAAVRDSFIVAWHHWRKVSRLEDPETSVRPHAWAHAQRRHTARLWHRDKRLDPEIKATLDALGRLPIVQRRALVLNYLTSLSLHDMARELGLPLAEAERVLQTATSQFSVHRELPTTSITGLFVPLREHVEGAARWPRPTIVRRAGAARRRTHTAVGVGAAVAGLVLTGMLVTDTGGLRPTLAREQVASGADGESASPDDAPTTAAPEDLPDDALLTAAQVRSAVPGKRLAVTDTTENTGGDGLVLPCQQTRYADPKGAAALVRTFDPPRPAGKRARPDAASAVQATELSTSAQTARRTFRTTAGWYAGCLDERVQLLSTRRVDGAGDQAMLLVLRDWDLPVSTIAVGVARTGQLTTTTMTRLPGTATPALGRASRLLAAAVGGLCHLPDSGACPGKPRMTVVAPLPVGEVPGMLSEVDLPPVTHVERPWVGTQPRKATANVAATRCDQADFNAAPMTNNLTRTFLIPKAKLPDQFGLTQTVGSLPEPGARAFVDRIRSRMAACPDKDLGTEVSQVAQLSTKHQGLSAWRVTTEISDKRTVTYYMGIARSGTSVGQVGFIPDPKVQMAPGAFVDLVHRAMDRLAALPPPRKG